MSVTATVVSYNFLAIHFDHGEEMSQRSTSNVLKNLEFVGYVGGDGIKQLFDGLAILLEVQLKVLTSLFYLVGFITVH